MHPHPRKSEFNLGARSKMTQLAFDNSLMKRIEGLGGSTASVCYQCGTCTASCPLGVEVRKLIREVQVGATDEVLNDRSIWGCATCKICELNCPRGVNITDLLHALRILAFEARKVPAKLEQALWGIYENGNPDGGKKTDRAKWAEGLNVAIAGKTKQTKYLLWAGCSVAYDPRLQQISRSIVEVLQKAGVDISILGEKESCCGDPVFQIGEEGYLEELVHQNIQTFAETGAENLITISPHCLNMFRNVYPHYGKTPNVFHYTEILSECLDNGDLEFKENSEKEIATTYHDPCYLGRYYGIYEQPRKLLENIPRTILTEMSENKENALCCGGGGGQMWNDGKISRPSHERVSQAAETNATVLASSCPYCIQNFEDAAKTRGMKLAVKDVSEILNQALRESV